MTKTRIASLIAALGCVTMIHGTASAEHHEKKAIQDGIVKISDDITFKPNLEYRFRFEGNGGKDFVKTDDVPEFGAQRARLGGELNIKDKFRVFIQAQDVRVWGEEANTLDFRGKGLDMHQAYLEFISCNKKMKIRIGRQELAYDNHRIIGSVNWTMQARSFDAIRIASQWGDFKVDLFEAIVSEADNFNKAAADALGHDNTTSVTGLWFNWSKYQFFKPSVLALYNYTDAANDKHLFTVGTHIQGKPVDGLWYSAEFYYQAGKNEADDEANDQDIAAMLAAVNVRYTLGNVPWKPSIQAWFEYLSGDDDLGDTDVKAFDTLFATNHKFYGMMDMFIQFAGEKSNTQNRGLMTIGGKLAVKPCSKSSLSLSYYNFNTAEKFDVNGKEESALGHEFDLVYKVKMNKYAWISAGGGLFLGEDAMSCLRGACAEGDDVKPEGYGFIQFDFKY